jgi:3-keto-disaccharide hydrolase
MTHRPRIASLVHAILVAALLSATAIAQNKRRMAYTDPKSAGRDYELQGEYLGVFVEDDRGRQVGLQVIANGGGKCAAVEYAGGLPGTGWNLRDRFKMWGEVRNGTIRLRSPRHRFRVTPDAAEILTLDGQLLGRLDKVLRVSPTLGKKPPKGAIVLFDGKDTKHFVRARMTKDGLLQAGTTFRDSYRDFTMHLEFQLPFMPFARGQGRGNSGLYIQNRYEVQILDSFGLNGAFNECGSMYRQRMPDLNMCLPPLQWQTYDIAFRAPRFDAAGKKTANARITVRHNGVLVHDQIELTGNTGAASKRPENAKLPPSVIQNHGNPVRFRNIWLTDRSGEPGA